MVGKAHRLREQLLKTDACSRESGQLAADPVSIHEIVSLMRLGELSDDTVF